LAGRFLKVQSSSVAYAAQVNGLKDAIAWMDSRKNPIGWFKYLYA
jgi:hypothetical protein